MSMSRWLDRANGLAAYARDTLAMITLWPLRRVLIAGLIGITLSSAAGWAVAHHWEEQTAQGDINDLGENRRLLLQDRLTDLEQTMSIVAARFQDFCERNRPCKFRPRHRRSEQYPW